MATARAVGRTAHGQWGEACLSPCPGAGGGPGESRGHPEKGTRVLLLPGSARALSVLTGATAQSPRCAAAACTNTDQMLPRMLRIRRSRLAWLPDPATPRTRGHSPPPAPAHCVAPASGPLHVCSAIRVPLPQAPISHAPSPPRAPPQPGRPFLPTLTDMAPQCHFISSRALSILLNGSFFQHLSSPKRTLGPQGQGHPCVVITAPSGQ